MAHSLYIHISPSNKVYVGITNAKPEWRWNHGKGYDINHQRLFASAIKKYGWENIRHEVIATGLTEGEAKALEILLISHYKSINRSYNITDGGDGSLGNNGKLGTKATEETRRKMSIARKGLLAGEKHPFYGKRGSQSHFYGKRGRDSYVSRIVYQYDRDGKFIRKWYCISDIEREYGFKVTNITAVCRGKGYTIGGYRWSYTYPYVFNPDERIRREEKCRKLSEKAKLRHTQKAEENTGK